MGDVAKLAERKWSFEKMQWTSEEQVRACDKVCLGRVWTRLLFCHGSQSFLMDKIPTEETHGNLGRTPAEAERVTAESASACILVPHGVSCQVIREPKGCTLGWYFLNPFNAHVVFHHHSFMAANSHPCSSKATVYNFQIYPVTSNEGRKQI